MATQAQIDANRLNAIHSTGPRSVEGKAASRFNALKSGLDANSLIIPGEDPAALEALASGYHEQFHPANPLEAHFVDALTRADWTRRRLSVIEANAIKAMVREQPEGEPNPLGAAILRDAAGPNALQKIFRHQNAQDRAYLRALAELRRLQAERQREELELAVLEQAATATQSAAKPAAANYPNQTQSRPVAPPPPHAEIHRLDPQKDDRALRL
jgi:hypothetical protein